MATAKNTDKENIQEIQNEINTNDIVKEKDKEIDDLRNKMSKLEGMLQALISNNNTNSANLTIPTPKMDKPCTLIHLLECPSDLPTTIKIGGIAHHFISFGEARTIRLADMQNVCSQYRTYFERGVFTVGDDCEEYKDEFGIQTLINNPISPTIYNRMETLDNKEFEKLIKGLNETQRVNISRTWIQRYLDKKDGYDNPEKIQILNRYTKDKGLFKNGMLADILNEVYNSEE